MSASPANPFPQLVRDQLQYLRTHRFGRLTFPAALEKRFDADTATPRRHRLFVQSLLMTVGFPFILMGDYATGPTRFHTALLVRVGIVFPLFLLCCWVLRRNTGRFWMEGSIVLAALGLAVSTFLVWDNVSPGLSASTHISLLIGLLATNVVMRLRFPFAIVASILCYAVDWLFLLRDGQLTHLDRVASGVPVLWASAFILFAAYTLEHEERLSYLLQLHTELQAEELASLNIELARLSTRDGLTGLANRAAFDKHLDLLWEAALANGTPLSAVIVDIDHFKFVNDTHGHLYGDQVIKRVAALLQESLRGKGDFAARYGGEEFVLLLPDTTHAAALRIAERIRAVIQLAGSPAPPQQTPQPGLWTTVSCGVSTVTRPADSSPTTLIHAADTALYRAKSDGRNCVRSAKFPTVAVDSSTTGSLWSLD